MLIFIRRLFANRKKSSSKREYSKTKVLNEMDKILDWQHGKKGTYTRDLYEAELKTVRETKNQPQA